MIGPEPFDPIRHQVAGFDCGDEELNTFLSDRAAKHMVGGGSVTWVVTDDAHNVIAYYASATGAVVHAEVPGRVRRNQPNPIPALVLGRLAVDEKHQGAGLGSGLLRHFLQKVIEVAEVVGVRLVIVNAKNERARDFYLRFGFSQSPVDDLVVDLVVQDLRQSLG